MSDIQKVHDARKIFFLFVPAVTEEMFIKKIIAHEYEAYTLSEDVALYLPVLQTFPDSIIFAYETNCPRNINWKDHYDKLTICCHDAGIKISTWVNENGLLKVNEDLTNFTPASKSIDFKSDSDAIFSHLLEMLDSMSAQGRRNSIRVTCDDGYSATFSIKILKNIYSGTILDISSVGMACSFNTPIEFKINAFIEDVQLRLNGQISHISGTVFGKREIEGKPVFVIIFNYRNSPETRDRIHEYVYINLQRKFRNLKPRTE